MNKNILFAIAFLLIIIFGGMVLLNNSKETNAPTQTTNENQNSIPVNLNEEFEKTLDSTSTEWVLSKISLNKKVVDIPTSSKPVTIAFDVQANTYSGFGGCNIFSGTYSSDDNYVFDFGAIVSTKMACTAINFEADFFQALDKVTSYGIKGNQLVFENEDGYTQLLYNPTN